MKKYETVFISDPDIQDQTRLDLFEKVRNVIARQNGYLIDFDDWGVKKLAYEVRKKLRGHYVCMTYGGTGDLVRELERNLGLMDDVMKFVTILLSSHVTLEQLEKEAEEAKTRPRKSEEDAESESGETDSGPADNDGSEAEASEETDEEAGETEEETK